MVREDLALRVGMARCKLTLYRRTGRFFVGCFAWSSEVENVGNRDVVWAFLGHCIFIQSKYL